jgi:hypothetical protein
MMTGVVVPVFLTNFLQMACQSPRVAGGFFDVAFDWDLGSICSSDGLSAAACSGQWVPVEEEEPFANEACSWPAAFHALRRISAE